MAAVAAQSPEKELLVVGGSYSALMSDEVECCYFVDDALWCSFRY